jgi:phosphotransferase system IIB component
LGKLIIALGGIDNIKEVSNTHSKIKVFFSNKNKIIQEDINKLKSVSGFIMMSNSITIIVGNSAQTVCKKITIKKTT